MDDEFYDSIGPKFLWSLVPWAILVCWAGMLIFLWSNLHGVEQHAGELHPPLNLTSTNYALLAGIFFVCAYALVPFEEVIHLRKSKPLLAAMAVIWVFVALAYEAAGQAELITEFVEHNLLEVAALFFFLWAAMSYINTMDERGVFNALKAWILSRGWSLRTVFWVTGLLAFIISPIADNLTTALLMASVAMAIGTGNRQFVVLACINIVVAANAGGAFSPFGDITTLMVWAAGKLEFQEFFVLVIPAIINWIIPAFIMSLFVTGNPAPTTEGGDDRIKRGGFFVILFFILTVTTAVTFHNLLHLPPVLGMMGGLGALQLFGYTLKMSGERNAPLHGSHPVGRFDIFHKLQQAEWDTLLFFFGVIFCVGGLSALGWLGLMSTGLYGGEWPWVAWLASTTGIEVVTLANTMVGIVSAIIDNIPVMFAVLSGGIEMSRDQWELVTLTAGVGGSLLSTGSAAGVALMGQARGIYTFGAHLKWTPAIAIGYFASVWAQTIINM